MKKFTKLLGIVLIIALVMSMGITAAFAQTEGTAAEGKGSITVSNASNGETYKVYKIFDATVTGTAGGAIAYKGTIPSGLTDYFTADSAGNISIATHEVEGEQVAYTDAEILAALKTWAEAQTSGEVASAVSDGSELTFAGLDYGYYVVTTTQGAAITVDSTNPNATIYDKNTKDTTLSKEADKEEYNIGDTVTYTVKYATMNYEGSGENAKKVVSFTIEDTLPDFLDDVTVTSIIIDQDKDGDASTGTDKQVDKTTQFDNKKITLPWVDATSGDSLYANGSVVIVTYTATLTDKAAIDGDGNTNKVTLTYKVKDDDTDHGKKEQEETIYTYALAFKKVDDKGAPLAGATFQLPFYVQVAKASDGSYVYAGTTAPATPAEGESATITNTVTTEADGTITIKGMKQGTYSITETAAPEGYNKLTAPFNVTAQKTGESVTTKITQYLDADGNVTETQTEVKVEYENTAIAVHEVKIVVNKTGVELPSTGGIGTTIFYVVGSILVVAAGVLLITKKRMSREG